MVLPNFLIIGAPKAGTSSLYYYLKQHPQIYMCREKEPHFFSLENSEINFKGPGDRKRYRNAVTKFEDYVKLFDSVTDETAIGEASTTYLSSPQAPERIKNYLPQVKLIAILRNPVDAAYASFLHLIRDGDENIADFAVALQQEETRIANNWDGIWHYQQRGFYYSQIKPYFELFNREQIKIYKYEELKDCPERLLRNILQFLNVEDQYLPDTSIKYNVSGMPKNLALNKLMSKPNYIKTAINTVLPWKLRKAIANRIKTWNYNQYQKPELSIEIRHQLIKSYQDDIIKLQDIIEIDLSNWIEIQS